MGNHTDGTDQPGTAQPAMDQQAEPAMDQQAEPAMDQQADPASSGS
jgi:hypothetical protein